MTTVTCTAPLTSILVDTNKGIRPCCYYQDGFLGNVNDNTISEIITNDKWKKLKEQMYANEWPNGCLLCKKNEETMGSSLRQNYFENSTAEDIDNEKLTYLEFNGSNICNLACVHCHSLYSSKWHIERKKLIKIVDTYDTDKRKRVFSSRPIEVGSYLDSDGTTLDKMHLPNPELVLENIKQLDLTNLRTLSFRGGEPFLNSETKTILEYADTQGLLNRVHVSVTTNGTYVDDAVIELLKKCKTVHINMSIDGIDDLFNYIRYGDAKFETIEPNLAKLNVIPNVIILISVASMNYNAFNLLEIRDWTIRMSEKYNKVQRLAGFNNCVVSPDYLSLATLSDDARKYLIEFYTKNSIDNEFQYVINLLANDFLGEQIHTQWVEYTELLETVRGNNIIDIVPQLKKELENK
jgi:MoaA/NifB/PqqE/SkfB family radical SAM enzyme